MIENVKLGDKIKYIGMNRSTMTRDKEYTVLLIDRHYVGLTNNLKIIGFCIKNDLEEEDWYLKSDFVFSKRKEKIIKPYGIVAFMKGEMR